MSSNPEEAINVSSSIMIPIAITTIASGAIAYLVRGLSSAVPPPAEIPGGLAGSGGLVLLWLLGAASGGLLIAYLIRHRHFNRIRAIFSLSMLGGVTFSLVTFFSSALEKVFGSTLGTVIVIVAGLLVLRLSQSRGGVRLVGFMVAAPLIGLTLVSVIPLNAVILLLVGLSIYDVFAVFHGPLKAVFRDLPPPTAEEGGLRDVSPLGVGVLTFRGITIGMGDLVLYSAVVGLAMLRSGPSAYLAGLAGVMAGAYLTLRLLMIRRPLPGLPLPILLGLGLIFLVGAL